MVLGIGALASLGLALPTGLAFGYGYGYGVRQGYSAFKPPSKTANDLKLSANPVTGALGAGLQSAEERTDFKTPVGMVTSEPLLATESQKLTAPSKGLTKGEFHDKYYQNQYGVSVLRSSIRTREQYQDFLKQRPKHQGRPKSRGRLRHVR